MTDILNKLGDSHRKRIILAVVTAALFVVATVLIIFHMQSDDTPKAPVSAANDTGQATLEPDVKPSKGITVVKVTAKQADAQNFVFTADVTTTISISKVEFYANSKLLGVSTKSPYTMTSSVASLPEGEVSIVAKAYDVQGGSKISDPIKISVVHQKNTSTSPAPGTSDSGTSGGDSSGGSTSGGSSDTATVPYVLPGSQGYKGSLSDLTVYSEANGQVPAGQNCSWDHTYKNLECRNTDLTLDHVYIQGGIYWDGCGNLTITNSIIDWKPSKNWHNIHAACDNGNAGASLTISYSTLRASGDGTPYTGSIDIGGVDVGNLNTGSARPMYVNNSVLRDFPQGLDPAGGSIIKNNEIYTADVWCTNSSEWCHVDGLFSQGGNNLTYQGNYIVTPTDPVTATAAIFFQSSGRTSGHKIIGNYIKGGAFTFYNQSADNITVENNTFGGGKFGDVSNSGTITSWINNKKEDGTAVPKP